MRAHMKLGLATAALFVSATAFADTPHYYTTTWSFFTADTSGSLTGDYSTNLNEQEAVKLPTALVDAGVACKRMPLIRVYDETIGRFLCTDGKNGWTGLYASCEANKPNSQYTYGWLSDDRSAVIVIRCDTREIQ